MLSNERPLMSNGSYYAEINISEIIGPHPSITNIINNYFNITYNLELTSAVSEKLCEVLIYDSPISVMPCKTGGYYVVGNIRTYEIALERFDGDKLIPVNIKAKCNDKCLQLYAYSVLIGNIVIYGFSSISEIGAVLHHIPSSHINSMFPGLITPTDMADALDTTRQTLFKSKDDDCKTPVCDDHEDLNEVFKGDNDVDSAKDEGADNDVASAKDEETDNE